MTKEQKVEMFSMRLDGATYEEIAEKFGISKQRVNQIIHKEPKNRCIEKKCIYSGLADYFASNGLSARQFFEKIQFETSYTSFMRKLKGTSIFTLPEIKKILLYTHMSFEECFAMKEEVKESKK